jgi:hypothetical protein
MLLIRRWAVPCAHLAVFAFAGDVQFLAFCSDVNAGRKGPVELAFGALDEDGAVSANFDGDFFRKGDGLFTDS